ncbi:phosphatidylinositol-specific phospholipase C domain-containing protein [Schaalia sp. Marseille-Q2122]|uniref:phosphatidylinositol-specific phospholipase C domain-containing protein n=1 Tax=Schaalia sp. Marseille-Q2122 TaxID=2736604 RepID=UPI00158E8F63|nr:phosphatidylinositol-specific phospholipase C domain-containing protein [Schaalia sp. Marseille-Q2122]
MTHTYPRHANASWMSALSDRTALTELAIPGTHDTMTAECAERYYATQHDSLAEQLTYGVRFLDIRLRRTLIAAHREWVSNISGQEILDTVGQFLADNPSECVIMRIQNANEAKDDYPEYGEAIRGLVGANLDLFHLWGAPETPWPELGQCRGRILALECAPPSYHFSDRHGIIWAQNWHDNEYLSIQDLWDGPTIEDKKAAITEALDHNAPGDALVLNHISATNGQLGYPDAYAEILNPFTRALNEQIRHERSSDAPRRRGRGVQIYDFSTPELTAAVISINA